MQKNLGSLFQTLMSAARSRNAGSYGFLFFILTVAFLGQCLHSLHPKGRRGTKKGEEQSRKQADGGHPVQLPVDMNKENQSSFEKENVCEDLARIIIKKENALDVVQRTQFSPPPAPFLELPEPFFIVTVKTGPGSERGRLGPLICLELGGPRPWPQGHGRPRCG